jgi:hypothetical protein
MPRVFENGPNLIDAPALNAFAVTPDDSNDLAHTARGIYCGSGGNLAVVTFGGDSVTFVALSGGVVHPITVSRVLATGTTALSIVAVY